MSATERIDSYPNVGLATPALIGSQSMTSELDIWRAAQATISRYGDYAGIHAAQRADELLAAGDGGWGSSALIDGRGVRELYAKGKAAGEIKAVWRWIKRRI